MLEKVSLKAHTKSYKASIKLRWLAKLILEHWSANIGHFEKTKKTSFFSFKTLDVQLIFLKISFSFLRGNHLFERCPSVVLSNSRSICNTESCDTM